ncbi:nucleolin-like [Alosa sapidissima]|uniref:nucleolin-like n=1 Tax=Alosa sapidissima TaxID=34773 RepID=UPI001C0816DF|nr:nucleolin-like [Alosa sapidissima]
MNHLFSHESPLLRREYHLQLSEVTTCLTILAPLLPMFRYYKHPQDSTGAGQRVGIMYTESKAEENKNTLKGLEEEDSEEEDFEEEDSEEEDSEEEDFEEEDSEEEDFEEEDFEEEDSEEEDFEEEDFEEEDFEEEDFEALYPVERDNKFKCPH